MVAVVKKVPPFFDASSLTAAGSVMSSQIEQPITPLPTSLTFQTEIPISPTVGPISSMLISRSQTPISRSQTPMIRSQTPMTHSQTPVAITGHAVEKRVRFKHKRAKSRASKSPTPEDSIVSDGDSSDTDSSSVLSTSTDTDDDDKIPKPDGEPGRPGRGGYNLERAINWPAKEYKKLKASITC